MCAVAATGQVPPPMTTAPVPSLAAGSSAGVTLSGLMWRSPRPSRSRGSRGDHPKSERFCTEVNFVQQWAVQECWEVWSFRWLCWASVSPAAQGSFPCGLSADLDIIVTRLVMLPLSKDSICIFT